jgi:hypothetical protein
MCKMCQQKNQLFLSPQNALESPRIAGVDTLVEYAGIWANIGYFGPNQAG